MNGDSQGFVQVFTLDDSNTSNEEEIGLFDEILFYKIEGSLEKEPQPEPEPEILDYALERKWDGSINPSIVKGYDDKIIIKNYI